MLRILLIDDTLVAETRLQTLIAPDSLAIIRAGTPEEAQRLLSDHINKFFVVVLDLYLGRNSEAGIDTLTYIRENYPNIPVFVWSKHLGEHKERVEKLKPAEMFYKFEDDTKMAELLRQLAKEHQGGEHSA